MAKDTTTVTFGIIYTVCIGLCWILLFFPTCYYIYCYAYVATPGGIFSLVGDLLLVPSLILYLIFFFSDEGHTSASVGFGLGLPGWILGLIGQVFSFICYEGEGIAMWLLAFYITLTVFGSLLFSRRHKWEADVSPTSPTTTRATLPSTAVPGPPCPNCNRATRYIPQYSRYFCDSCQKYT